MMNECKVCNCGYWYQDRYEEHPSCHYNDPRFPAPCEEEEEYVEGDIYDDEMGFDPYEGCYTWDC